MSAPAAIAHIAELWRYPVKGMRGESVAALEVVPEGVAGDRRYAFQSSGAPAGKPMLTGRERAAMLLYQASIVGGQTFVEAPEGERFHVEDPALVKAMEAALPQGNRLTLQHCDRPFTDCRPIAIFSTDAIAALAAGYGEPIDARRFRANIAIGFDAEVASRGMLEDDLVGKSLHIGGAVLEVTERDPRCRIITLDPETAEPEPRLMKYLDRHHEGCLGVYARTVTPGLLQVGDVVFVA